jgi:hypothetical protein
VIKVNADTDCSKNKVIYPKGLRAIGRNKFASSVVIMILLCWAVIFYSCSETDFSDANAKMTTREYRIIGDTGTFRIEVRKMRGEWQLLAEGVKSRKECDEIIKKILQQASHDDNLTLIY